MLRRRGWFPPKLGYKKAVVDDDVVDSLKGCKVIADRSCVDQHLFTDTGTTLVHARPKMLLDFFRNDLIEQRFTDLTLRNDNAGGKKFRVHKLVLAAHSFKFGTLFEEDDCLVIAGVEDRVLEQVVTALYHGVVVLQGRKELRDFEEVLKTLQALDVLINLQPSLLRTSDGDFASPVELKAPNKLEASVELATPVEKPVVAQSPEATIIEDVIAPTTADADGDGDHKAVEDEHLSVVAGPEEEGDWEVCSFSKPGPRRSKRVPIPRRFSSGSDQEEAGDKKLSEAVESKPPAVGQVQLKPKRKQVRSEETKDNEEEIKSNPEPKPKKAKKDDDEEKKNLKEEDLVKSSPRLRQKPSTAATASTAATTTTPKATPEKSKSSPPEVETKSKASAKPKASAEPAEVTPAKPPRLEITRPQRKSAQKMSPDKRKSLTVEEEAKSPKFDAVSDELLNEKVKEGHLRFVEWLMETQFLRSKPVQCCDADATLEVDEGSIDGVAWGCGACGRRQTVRTGSIFAKSCDESLCWIMRLILCWSDNVRLVKFQPLSLFLVLPSL